MAGKTIKGITVQIGAETTGLDKALKNVNKQSREIGKELRDINKGLRFNPKNTELLSQKQKVLGDQVATTREKLDRLKAAQEQVNEQFKKGEISEEQYRAFQREVVETESKLKHYENQLKQVNGSHVELGKSVQEAGKRLQDVGKKMQDVGDNLTKKLTVPLVGIGVGAFKASTDFETAFTGVRKVVEGTEEDFDNLRQGIIDMSNTMPQSAVEIANVAEEAGKLGIQTENILEFTETMVMMGDATDLSSDQAAESLARLANITGMSQEDFSNLGSSIVALGNNFATTEPEIVNMGLRLAGTAAQVGMSEHEMLALATAMSSVGINAEAGGSSMSRVMQKINTEVLSSGDKLSEFAEVAGMTAEEFATTWQERPSEAIQKLIEGLDGVNASGGDVTTALKGLGITSTQEIDTMLRLAGANNTLSAALDVSARGWEENTALAEEAGIANDTTGAKLETAKNNVVNLAMEIGDRLAPKIVEATDKVREITDKFKELSPETKDNIVKIGLLIATIGPLISILARTSRNVGTLIDTGGKLIKNWDKIKDAGALLSSGLAKSVGFLFSPAGAILVGIAAAIAIGVALWKNWDTIKQKASQLGSFLSSKFKQIGDAISKPFKAAADFVGRQVQRIKDFFSKLTLKIPKPKVPKFELSGKFNLMPPSVPRIKVKWHAKGGLMDGATLFGTKGNTLLGGGEAGKEGLVPLEGRHMYPLADAIADRLNNAQGGQVIVENMYVRDDTDIHLISRELFNLNKQAQRSRGRR